MMRLLLIIVSIGCLTACRSSKKIQTAMAKKDTSARIMVTPSPQTNDSVQFINSVLKGLVHNRIDFKTFSAKINVIYLDADNRNYNVNAFVRMHKDSAIWVSINAIFGIEAMRALVTKDSVKLLDKQNKVYTAQSIDYLQEVTDLPLNLPALQDLIIGNPVFLDSNIVTYTKNGNAVSLLSIGQWFKNLITLNASDKTLLHCKLDDVNMNRNRTADLTYADYDGKQSPLFSTTRRITVAEKNKLDITLNFKQYDFNSGVSFPFAVPKNYRRK
jgi:Domain of unknown function (DUF4292)